MLATIGALAGLEMLVGGSAGGLLLLLICGGLSVFIWSTTAPKQSVSGLPERKS